MRIFNAIWVAIAVAVGMWDVCRLPFVVVGYFLSRCIMDEIIESKK